jgi:hypothetical protein
MIFILNGEYLRVISTLSGLTSIIFMKDTLKMRKIVIINDKLNVKIKNADNKKESVILKQ